MGWLYRMTALFGCMLIYRCAESHWHGERLLNAWTLRTLKPEMVEEGNRIALLREIRGMERKNSHDNERGVGRRRKRKEKRYPDWARPPLTAMSGLRGGYGDEFENLDMEAMHQTAVEEEDFAEETILSRALLAWKRTPIITRNFFTASTLLTLYGWLFNNNHWPSFLDMQWKKTIFHFQIWRPLTSFLFFGPFGVNYLITSHFIWTYMGELERMHFRQPETFFIMMVFGAGTLLAVTTVLGLSSGFLGHSLSCFLVYVWSRKYEGAEVNVMDIFTLRVEVLPWFFVVQTLILEGQTPILDLMGIFSGYLYQLLKLKGKLNAPAFLVRLFEVDFIRRDYNRFTAEFGDDVMVPTEPQIDMGSDSISDDDGEIIK